MMNTIIVFRVGNERIGVDISKVREVTEAQIPVPVPKSPKFVLGLVNIRGDIIPVLSLKERLGFSGDETGNLLLIVEDRGRLAGIKVDELYGTEKVDEMCINRNAEFISAGKERDFFLGLYEGKQKPILILNLEKTLSKEDK